MSTPHNQANVGDFAKTVLMPGDPKRAKFIAENFFDKGSVRLVNDVRGIQGYTGTYKGKPVSVMASGMGMPSIGIYSHELFNFYNVENIIRVGSAGSIQPNIHVGDIVIGIGACTDSNYASQFSLAGTFAPTASYRLIQEAMTRAHTMDLNYKIHVGNILSSDTFYADNDIAANKEWTKMGVMAIEMEAAALYMEAAVAKKRALAICTISDSLITGEEMSAEERQESLTDMIVLALETAINI